MNNAPGLMFDITGSKELTEADIFKLVQKSWGKSIPQGFEKFEKSNRVRRYLQGFAAGANRDFELDKFLVKSIDFSYLKSPQGSTNYDHDSRLRIGRPIFAGLMNDPKDNQQKLYYSTTLMERQDYPGVQYKDIEDSLEAAEKVWAMQKAHEADPLGMAPHAFSVEGGKQVKHGNIVKSLVTAVAVTPHAVNPEECTVQAFAKSLKAGIQAEEAVNLLETKSFPLEEINDFDSLMVFCRKSFGMSADESYNFIKTVRGLNG